MWIKQSPRRGRLRNYNESTINNRAKVVIDEACASFLLAVSSSFTDHDYDLSIAHVFSVEIYDLRPALADTCENTTRPNRSENSHSLKFGNSIFHSE